MSMRRRPAHGLPAGTRTRAHRSKPARQGDAARTHHAVMQAASPFQACRCARGAVHCHRGGPALALSIKTRALGQQEGKVG